MSEEKGEEGEGRSGCLLSVSRATVSGPVIQWRTVSHLFQLCSSASVSITGTVRVKINPHGYCERREQDLHALLLHSPISLA